MHQDYLKHLPKCGIEYYGGLGVGAYRPIWITSYWILSLIFIPFFSLKTDHLFNQFGIICTV